MNYYDPRKRGIEFLGSFIQQNYYALIVWNEVIQSIRPDLIIEIGTGNGNWTRLLRLMSYNSLTEIHTYDIKNVGGIFDVVFHNENVFDAHPEKLIDNHKLTIVLCDGGNKIEEFNYFAKFLKKNDIIAAHDYIGLNVDSHWNCSEIKLNDVKESVKNYDLKPFMQDDFNNAAWLVFSKQ